MGKVYGVWAVRSAQSVFGHKEAWCKDDGKPLEFPTYEAAAAYARELNQKTTVNVHYYPKERRSVKVSFARTSNNRAVYSERGTYGSRRGWRKPITVM